MSMRVFSPLVGSDFVKLAIEAGLLPQGTTRFIIDSGLPGGVVTVHWSGYGDQELLNHLVTGLVGSFTELTGEQPPDIGKSVLEEREACAKIAEQAAESGYDTEAARDIAQKIRQRS